MSAASGEPATGSEERLRRHVYALAGEIGPRPFWDGAGLARAEAYIRSEFEAAGLVVERRSYRFFGREVANLVGAPAASRDARGWYLVGAHYDTVRGTPGADDNASAVAVLLELARRFAGSLLPLRFVAFTLEEPPAFGTPWQGSRRFCRETKGAASRCSGRSCSRWWGLPPPASRTPPYSPTGAIPRRAISSA